MTSHDRGEVQLPDDVWTVVLDAVWTLDKVAVFRVRRVSRAFDAHLRFCAQRSRNEYALAMRLHFREERTLFRYMFAATRRKVARCYVANDLHAHRARSQCTARVRDGGRQCRNRFVEEHTRYCRIHHTRLMRVTQAPVLSSDEVGAWFP